MGKVTQDRFIANRQTLKDKTKQNKTRQNKTTNQEMQISKKKKNHLSIHNQGEPLLQVGMYQCLSNVFSLTPPSLLPPPFLLGQEKEGKGEERGERKGARISMVLPGKGRSFPVFFLCEHCENRSKVLETNCSTAASCARVLPAISDCCQVPHRPVPLLSPLPSPQALLLSFSCPGTPGRAW